VPATVSCRLSYRDKLNTDNDEFPQHWTGQPRAAAFVTSSESQAGGSSGLGRELLTRRLGASEGPGPGAADS
jgi:hypothetical protein